MPIKSLRIQGLWFMDDEIYSRGIIRWAEVTVISMQLWSHISFNFIQRQDCIRMSSVCKLSCTENEYGENASWKSLRTMSFFRVLIYFTVLHLHAKLLYLKSTKYVLTQQLNAICVVNKKVCLKCSLRPLKLHTCFSCNFLSYQIN